MVPFADIVGNPTSFYCNPQRLLERALRSYGQVHSHSSTRSQNSDHRAKICEDFHQQVNKPLVILPSSLELSWRMTFRTADDAAAIPTEQPTIFEAQGGNICQEREKE